MAETTVAEGEAGTGAVTAEVGKPTLLDGATGGEATDESKPAFDPNAWMEVLPDDLKSNPSLQPYKGKGVDALARSFIDAQRKIGSKGLILPTKDAPPEAWKQFWTAIGAPEKPDGYEFPKENVPEIPVEDGTKEWLKNTAHELGFTKSQFAALWRRYAHRMADAISTLKAQQEQKRDENVKALRKEWAGAFDQQKRLANLPFEKFDPDGEAISAIDAAGLSHHPAVVKFMARLGRNFAEDEVTGGGKNQSFTKTPDDANREIDRLRLDKDWSKAFYDAYDPAHAEAVKQYNELARIAHPEPVENPVLSMG